MLLWEPQEENVSRSSQARVAAKRSSIIRTSKSLLGFVAVKTTGDFEYSF